MFYTDIVYSQTAQSNINLFDIKSGSESGMIAPAKHTPAEYHLLHIGNANFERFDCAQGQIM